MWVACAMMNASISAPVKAAPIKIASIKIAPTVITIVAVAAVTPLVSASVKVVLGVSKW